MQRTVIFSPGPSTRSSPLLSPDEFIVSLDGLKSQPSSDRRPIDYDVARAVQSLAPPRNDASLVVCVWDSDGMCSPFNLAPLKCPKVLVLGDTHHGLRPLSRAITLAQQEPWNLIVLTYNNHHIHWFDEAGLGSGRTIFIPSIGLAPIRLEVPRQRSRGVTFCGNLGPPHVFRRWFIRALQERSITIEVHEGDQAYCARIYNESVVSLNLSLNGDFNQRNFEIVAAGGFCLADRTACEPPVCVGQTCKDVEEAEKIIRHMLAHPEESLAIARRDHETYWSSRTPPRDLQTLLAALAAPKGNRFSPTATFHDRLTMYEDMQELNRQGRVHWEDFDDLRRWPPETYPGGIL